MEKPTMDGGLNEIVPLTSSQRELWLSSKATMFEFVETASRGVYYIDSAVDPVRLRESLELILGHFPLQGAQLHQDGEEPGFEIGAVKEVDFQAFDVRGEADPLAAAKAIFDAFFEESLERASIRYLLVNTGDSSSLIAIKGSHLVIDGLGMIFLIAVIADVYTALARGEPAELGPVCPCAQPYQEDRAHRASSRYGKDLAFWEGHLARMPERRIFRALPGHPDLLGQSRHKKYFLSEAGSRAINDLAARDGVGPAVSFTAIHALAVAFMCDEKEIVVQAPVTFGERKRPAQRQGSHVTTPSVLVDLREHASFATLQSDIAAQNASFFRHIRTPYQDAMRRLGNKDFSFLADTFLNYLPNNPTGTELFRIRGMEQWHSDREAVLFGAMVLQEASLGCFSLTVRSSRNHFTEQDVERYVRRVEHLARQLIAGADLSDLDYLLDEEKEELARWQQGVARSYPIRPLPALFDERAVLFPDRPAVRDETGESLSYAQVRENSRRCAAWLAEKGVGPGAIVAVRARRTLNLPEVVLGIQRLGAVYLPLDPQAPAERSAFIIADAGVTLEIDVDDQSYRAWSPLGGAVPGPVAENGAYLIYTSGSTGRPKGVLVPHGGFANMIQGQIEAFGVGPDDHVLLFAPPIFDASLSEMFMALLAGACLYPVGERIRNAPWALKTYMADNGISVVTFPPSYLGLFERAPFQGLRVLITAGEPPVAADALHYAKSLRYFNAYGPTETCVCASMKLVSPDERTPIGVGRPIPNGVVSIRDGAGRVRPAGMVGEIWIGGDSVALGYHNNKDLTEQRFRPLPDMDGKRAYASGDLGLWSSDGEILLVGRADDQVKVRGNRVELGEVSFLLERCDAVSQALVLATKDAAGQTSLSAFLVLRPGAALDGVVAWSRDNLPAYMIPSAWHVLETMPIGGTGKIDRTALKNMARPQAPARQGERRADRRLLEICDKVLGRGYDPEANFFSQGGNSLQAMSLLYELRKAFGVDLAFRAFAACETLFDLEALLGESRGRRDVAATDTAALGQGQFRIWAYQQANEGTVDYNMPLLLELRGEKAPSFLDGLRRALGDQDLLSCTVAGAIDDPRFVRNDAGSVPMREEHFPDEAAAWAFLDRQIHTPFDLRREPPARLVVARLPDARLQVLLLVHHIAGDGETLDILLKNALRHMRGEPCERGVLATQAEFCRREEEYARSSAWREDGTYWQGVLTPVPPRITPPAQHKGAMEIVDLAPPLVEKLDGLARRTGATVLSCFVALLARFLCRRHDRPDMMVGVPVGLRETREEFGSAGFFVNTLPLRVADAEAEDIATAVGKTARQFRDAVLHSRYRDFPVTPEFLATHAEPGDIEVAGLTARRLSPRLKASKFSGSFTLETGKTPRLILEYDRGAIADGQALLRDLAQEIEATLAGSSRRQPRLVLGDAWRDILLAGRDGEVGDQSEFFKDGGDSIKAIQITGFLHRHGLTGLAASDFMRSPRFPDLCALLEQAGEASAEGKAVYAAPSAGRNVPLLPFQQFFIETHPVHWKTFAMLLPMELAADVSPATLDAWLGTLPGNYEALRLAFSTDHATILAEPQRIALETRSFGQDVPLEDMLRAATGSIVARLDPESGKTVGACLALRDGKRFLLLAGHHLVLDSFSLDVLRRDLCLYCRTGEASPERHGVATRAVHLESLIEAGSFPTASDRDFWEDLCATPAGALGVARQGVPDLTSERIYLRMEMEGFVPEYSPSVPADLLSALSCALHGQGQRDTVFVTLESHGRDDLLEGFDASRSLGWFTAVCPMPLTPASSCAEAGKTVLPWIKSHFTSLNCNAYGYLRREDPRRFGYDSQIVFNYVGKVIAGGESDAASSLAGFAAGAIPELLHPDLKHDSPLELGAFFDDAGVLRIGAYFNPRILPVEWVSGLLERWRGALETLPAHLPEKTRAAICTACGCKSEEIERIALPDPSHEPLLYQSLVPGEGVYSQQVEFYFKGTLDPFLLMRAWEKVVARHESLRTLFPMPIDGEFFRAILREARMGVDYHDFSGLPEADAAARIKALLLAQRTRGFDLQKGPLLWAQFFRQGADTTMMAWSFHHLLMDGWCMGILLGELFDLYRELDGRPGAALPEPVASDAYGRWRAQFDASAARAYWTSLLTGFIPLTGVAPRGAVAGSGDPDAVMLVLDEGTTGRLQAVAVERAVTLPVLIQTLWGLVLGAENGSCRDVVFGVVASGRPAEIEGIDRAVGLFIQTLPLRVRWHENSTLETVLADVKEQGLWQTRHGYLPLAEIGRDLLDHLIVFENYPLDTVYDDGRVELVDVQGYEMGPYPLGITVIPGRVLTFRFLFDPARMERGHVQDLADRLGEALRAVGKDRAASCMALETVIALPRRRPIAAEESRPAPAPRGQDAAALPHDGSAVLDRVLECYQSVLGRPIPSPDADFFQMGGHSLLALRLMAQIRKKLSVAVGIEDIMANPSARGLAARILGSQAPVMRIPRLALRARYPLSAAQQRIWFLQKLHGPSAVYAIPFAARFLAPVDRDLLQKALFLLEDRHDALRLRVAADVPEQMLAPPGGLRLEIRDEAYADGAFAIAAPDFGPDQPLVRVALFCEGDGGHVLAFCAHHIVFDGWSAEIFTRELNEAYEALSNGAAAPAWQPLELDFASYADWESRWEPTGGEALRDRLLPVPERLRLPLDFPRPAMQSLAGKVVAFDLGRERSLALRRHAQEAGVTVFPVLVALVDAFLHRHTGQEDLIVGCPAANREFDQTQGMIGLFVNTLAIRVRLDADKGFSHLLRVVDEAVQGALAAQSVPFEKLVGMLGVERNIARNPLFDVFVALEDSSWADHGKAPLRLHPIALPHGSAKFDLSFYFREAIDGGFAVHVEYATALFREDTIQAMADRFLVLADAVLRRDDVPLAALDILPTAERARLQSFNQTDEDLDVEHDIDGLFRARSLGAPDAVAIIEPSGRTCGYAAFDARIDAMAAYLSGQGLAPGDHAGVCFERSLDMMVCIFAVLRLGAVYVPLSPSLPAFRLSSILDDLGDGVVVTQPGLAGTFTGRVRRVLVPDLAALPAGVPPAERVVSPDSVAYVIFTSGSTGRPKGVQIEHRSVCNRLLWMQSRFPIGEGDVVLQKTTISFDVSVWELFWWSWCGASLALLEPGAEGDPARIVSAIQRHRVSVIHFVPSMLRAFLDHLDLYPEEAARLSSLRYVFASGEALPRELVARFNALLGAELHNLYGPTEATVDVSWQPCLETPLHGVPIGRPIANTRLHVLDRLGNPVPIGVTGEIYIGGIQVARGYLNRPEQTAQRFLADPSDPKGRLYRTGDLGRWRPDGSIDYLGRNDDQVKIRGFRIELGEVEAALGQCSGVSQAVVRLGSVGGGDALEAFLLPHEGAVLSLAGVRDELARLVPDYMCPALFFLVQEIPLGPSGKADRSRLQGQPLQPAAGGGSATGGEDALRMALRAIWRQVMPEVDVSDGTRGFFEAGGNSLLLVRLHALLDERWPGLFTLARLFSDSSIEAQARHVEQAEGVVPDSVAQVRPDAPVAVIGMAVRFGDYGDTEQFWKDLAEGTDKTQPMPSGRRGEVRQVFEAVGYAYDEARVREAAYLADVSAFDYRRFGFSPSDASLLDPKQRLFLEVAMQALDDSGYGGAALENAKVGTFVGASPYRLFQDAVTRAFPDQAERIYLLNVPSNVVARISYLKNWRGPAATIDTACSSVLAAVHDACGSLRAGESTVALVGGAHIIDLPVKSDRKFTIEASSGRTRTFDADADGVGAGEGAAVFVLKLLEEAQRDGDAIHAVILGSAVNQDGKSSSMAAPNPEAQAEVIALAAEKARVSLAEIDFFEAHGTATMLGDPIEIEGISRAFARTGVTPGRKALVGSVKGNIGHLDAAAGAAGMAKAILCLKKGFVPPQPHFERPNPHIDFDAAPVQVARMLEPLPRMDRAWHCGVSSFGLSGVNTHVILAGHAAPTLPGDDGSWLCVPFSAQDEAALTAYVGDVVRVVAANADWPLHAVAATLVAGRESLGVRAAVVARSVPEFLDALAGGVTPVIAAKGREVGAFLAPHATRQEAEEAALAFLRGGRIDWPEERPIFRVHLPATPFSRTPLWPRFPAGFVAAPVPSPAGTVHALSLGQADFWPVSEHLLQGVPTLVGMGLSELIGEALGRGTLAIDNLRWRKPASVGENSQAVLLTTERDGAVAVELHHFSQGNWQVAASATVLAETARPGTLDIAALRDAMAPFVPEPMAQGVSLVGVSKRWECRKAIWMTADGGQVLAFLSLPEAFRHDLQTFKWHPAMLDVAASLALHGVSGFVPAACATMRLHRSLPAEIHAHVTITGRKPGMITADCRIADVSGQILVEMSGLVFVASLAVSPTFSRPRPELFSIAWADVALPRSSSSPGEKVMVVGAAGEVLARVADAIAALRRDLPDGLEARRTLAGEIAREAVAHLLYLPSGEEEGWALPSLLQEICRAGLRRPLHVTVAGQGALLAGEPDRALPLGPVLCLGQEEPLVSACYVEMASWEPAALDALAASLGLVDGSCLVAGDGTVRVPRLTMLNDTGTREAISAEGCVVITGGLGGMGLTLAERIATLAGARVVLLHRRAEVPADLPFAAYRCDVTDAFQVNDVFARIREEIGPIQGVIHAAGIAGDGYLLSKSQADYQAVLAPKVAGTWNIHEATLKDDLSFFVLASSRTALSGAPGQSDYAAANAFLNAFARYRQGRGLPALAICWNTWSEVGMAAGLAAERQTATLAPEQAYDVLTAALTSGVDVVAVAMQGEEAGAFPLATPRGAAMEPSSPDQPPARPARPALEAELLEILQDCLGYETALKREDDFFELGGDSIAGTQIISRVDQSLGIKLGIVDLLESTSLGDFIDRALAASEPNRAESATASGVGPAPAREKYPVGPEQMAILYADMASGGNTGFNLPAFLRLPPDLDKARLEAAIGALIRRHEVLRTSFGDFDAERPTMVVHPFEGFILEEIHLPDLSGKESLIKPFDLRRERGFRVSLLVVGGTEHVLFMDIHHALADGRTISLFNAELYKLYNGQALAPVSAQQKDFAWHRVTHPNPEAKAYWLERFKGVLPRLDLPGDFPRPPIHTGRGGMHEFALPPALVSDVKALARRAGVTNYHVVLCAWSILAAAHGGRQDVVVAVSVDSRDGHLDTAGMLASLLPVRLAVDLGLPLASLLENTRMASNDALRHRSYILNDLLMDLRPPVAPERSPLSEMILSYMNYEFGSGDYGLFEALRFDKRASKTDLSIFASDTNEGISFALEYYADLFSHASVVGMADEFMRILALMTSGQPDAPLAFSPTRAGLGHRHHESREIGRTLGLGVAALAAEKHVSRPAVVLAAFAALLSRVMRRQNLSIEVGPGMAVSVSIDDETEFEDLLGLVHGRLLNGREDTPRAAEVPPGEDSPTLGFAYRGSGEEEETFGETASDLGLFCLVREGANGLVIRFDYDPRVLADETARNWLTYFERFLDGITKENAR